MPQLPSGLHFALDLAPLQKILDEAEFPQGVHQLMAIENVGHLFPHVDVLYFRQASESDPVWQYSEESAPRPEGLIPYPSGFNLSSIRAEYEKWSTADKEAFVAFLDGENSSRYFEHTLSVVREHQELLLEQPTTTAGLMATWWKLGCHPLQKPIEDE